MTINIYEAGQDSQAREKLGVLEGILAEVVPLLNACATRLQALEVRVDNPPEPSETPTPDAPPPAK